MIQILDNGQVLKQDKTDTYEQWLPIGMEKTAQISVDKTTLKVNENITVTLAWTKINFTTEEWDEDTSNQEAFNLVAGDQQFAVTVNPGTQTVSFPTVGTYTIGVRNSGKGSRDITVTITQ